MKQAVKLDEMTVSELRGEAQKRGISGVSQMRKAELVEELRSSRPAALKPVNRAARAAQQGQKANAISVLTDDHKLAKKLFAQALQKETGDESIQPLAQQIVKELEIHSEAEEKFFYPAVKAKAVSRQNEDARDEVLESFVEHGSLKDLIRKLEETQPSDESYRALVQVMSEQFLHHSGEEEQVLFKQAKKLLDANELEEIGQQILDLKKKLGAS